MKYPGIQYLSFMEQRDPVATQSPITRPGRSSRNTAERIIGTAGVAALAEADLFIVSGDLLREFTGVLAQSKLPDDTKPE